MGAERDLAAIEKTATRLKKLYTAAVYVIMDEMGLPHQCLDLYAEPPSRSLPPASRPKNFDLPSRGRLHNGSAAAWC